MITPSQATIAIVASILTELSKYVPEIRNSQGAQTALTIGFVAIGTFIDTGTFNWTTFLSAFLGAVVFYHGVTKPVAQVAGLRTQA